MYTIDAILNLHSLQTCTRIHLLQNSFTYCAQPKRWELFNKNCIYTRSVLEYNNLQLQSITTHVEGLIPSILVANKGLHNSKKERAGEGEKGRKNILHYTRCKNKRESQESNTWLTV